MFLVVPYCFYADLLGLKPLSSKKVYSSDVSSRKFIDVNEIELK